MNLQDFCQIDTRSINDKRKTSLIILNKNFKNCCASKDTRRKVNRQLTELLKYLQCMYLMRDLFLV